MLLRKMNTQINARSQGQPGFAANVLRACTVLCALAALIVSFTGFDYLNNKIVFEISSAEASAGMAAGVEPAFSLNQKRHIQRALSANHDNLFKLQGASIVAAFGAPSLVRADLPTIVWQYRSESCVLDVYFKSDNGKASFAPVVHYEMRKRNGEVTTQPNEQKCLKSLLPTMNAPRMLDVSAFYKSYM